MKDMVAVVGQLELAGVRDTQKDDVERGRMKGEVQCLLLRATAC